MNKPLNLRSLNNRTQKLCCIFFLYLPFHPFIHHFIKSYLSIYLYIYLSIYPSIYLTIYLSIHPYINISNIYLFRGWTFHLAIVLIELDDSDFRDFHVDTYLYIYLYIYLSIYLSIYYLSRGWTFRVAM